MIHHYMYMHIQLQHLLEMLIAGYASINYERSEDCTINNKSSGV